MLNDRISLDYTKELGEAFEKEKASRGAFTGEVERVIDGDTFVLAGRQQHVRLKGVNAPERNWSKLTSSEKKTLADVDGENSYKELQDILDGKRVKLSSVEAQSGKNHYGERITALVYTLDGTFVNAEIIRRGWAVPEPDFASQIPYDEMIMLDQAVKEARTNKRGLWSKDPGSKLLEQFIPISPTNLDPIDKLEEYRNIPGATRLGTMWLYVPPAQITITEHNSNVEWPTMRTPGTPRLRSTQQEQRIEMVVIFPNMWSINYQLRPLIAQFIRSPFLPLENDHIRSMVMPSYLNSVESVSEQLGSRFDDKTKISKLIAKRQEEEGKRIAEDLGKMSLGSVADNQYQVKQKPSATKVDDRQLFIALRNIVVATIPGTPEALQVTFTMTVFNYLPHMEKVEYLRKMPDLENQLKYLQIIANMRFPDTVNKQALNIINSCGTTTNASDSEPFKRYYKTLLSETQIGQTATPVSWVKGMMPRLSPLQSSSMYRFKFILPTNTLSAEDVARNQDEIGTLETLIQNKITEAIRARTRKLLGNDLVNDTVGQLLKSTTAVMRIYSDFLVRELPRSVKNFETKLSNKESFSVSFGDYLDANSTDLLTSIKGTMLTDKSTAYDILKAAIGDAIIGADDIIRATKRIFELDSRNVVGTKGTTMEVVVENNGSTTITGASATFSPTIVPISIVDHIMPSCQFLGRSDWMMSINLMTNDFTLVRRLATMSQVGRLSQIANERSGIRWFMVKLNSTMVPMLPNANGLFSYLGISRVLFEDCVYESVKEKPGWFNVSLRLVQSDIDMAEYESLIPTNKVRAEVVRSIINNIASGTVSSNKNKTVQRMFNTVKAVFRQSMKIFSTLSLVDATEEDIDELSDMPEVIGGTIRAMDNLEKWSEHVKKLLISKDNRYFQTDTHISGNDVDGYAIIKDEDTSAPWFFDERARISRLTFQQAINSAVITAIATDPEGILEIYDPTLAKASESQRMHAIKLLTFSSDIRTTSPLHGCYPDLELPSYTVDPLIVGPDFFYKKEERIAPEATRIVSDRLESLYKNALSTMGRVKATGEVGKKAEEAMNSLPGDIIPDIRLYSLYKQVKEQQGSEEIVNSSGSSADEVYKNVKRIMESGKITMPSDEEDKTLIDELDAQEYANVSAKEQVSMYRVSLAFRIATLQDMIKQGAEKEESVRYLTKQRDTLLEEYNAIPKYASVGTDAMQNIWGVATPSTIKRSYLYMQKAAEAKVLRARSEEVSGSLARVYPTMKLYFIEEDPHEWQLFDDYYEYSSIRSAQVVMSDDSASKVATIQISNITQRLTDAKPGLTEVSSADQTSQEQTLTSFLLREGMTIMIRMGYSNDPLLLERVFFGKVVSVSPGDTIQIVAQSFGAEFMSQVFNGEERNLGYLGTTRSHGDVLSVAMSDMDGLDHFGNRNWLEMLRLKDPTFASPTFEGFAYSNPKYKKWDYYTSIINPIKKLIQFGVYDPRFENMYIPFSGNTWSGTAQIAMTAMAASVGAPAALLAFPAYITAKIMGKETPSLSKAKGDECFDWYTTPGTTLWDMMQEMALYYEDYIVTTLPYNEDIAGWQRETIYIGPRSGYYKYTERFDDEKTASDMFKKNKEMYDLPLEFSDSNRAKQKQMVLQKMAEDRGMNGGITDGKIITYSVRNVSDPFITTRDDAGVVVATNYGGSYHPSYGYYVIIEMTDNRSVEIVREGTKNYTMVYGLSDPKDLVDIIFVNESIGQGQTLGYCDTNVKQIFIQPKTAAIPNINTVWGNYINMVEKNVDYELKQFVSVSSDATVKTSILGLPVNANVSDVTRTRPSESQKDAAKYTINIKNPEHIIDSEGKPAKGYASVVNYHWVDSRHDIIENTIMATAENLHNKVTIRFPDDPGSGTDNEFTMVADDNIKPGNLRHLIVKAPNIDPVSWEFGQKFYQLVMKNPLRAVPSVGIMPAKYTVTANILANEMRKMYGGYLRIWGRPSIKPFDVVYMNDMSNQMFGPFEVGQVIHDFNMESGFTTMLIPRAVINVRNRERMWHDIALNGLIVPYFNTRLYKFALFGVDPIGAAAGAFLSSSKGIKAVKGTSKLGVKVAATLTRKTPFVGSSVEAAQQLGKTIVDTVKSYGAKAAGATASAANKLKGTGSLASYLTENSLSATRQATASAAVRAKATAAVAKGTKFASSVFGTAAQNALGLTQIATLAAVGVMWSKSVDKIMGRDIINVTGLWYNGAPLTAGMEGAYKDSYRTHFMDTVSSWFTISSQQDTFKGSAEQ
jgi:endonuclease YncB( thermonuclease family)